MPFPIPLLLGLAQVAGAAAPLIGRLVGGDDAEAAGQVIGNIAKAVTGESTPESALEVLKADPAMALEFEKAVLANKNELEAMYLKDRQDARARDVAIRQAGQRNTRADVMVVVVGLVLAGIVWQLNTDTSIPDGVLAIYNMMVGAFLKMLSDAFQFEFGSSRGSKEKDLMNALRGRDQ